MLPDNIIGDLVKEVAGEEAIPLVNLIKKRGNVSEFKLAEKLNIGVNQVRNLLYKLSAYNLVSFTRKKDKKKGWYIYYWDFSSEKAGDLIITIKKKKLNELKEKLDYETNQTFFICPDKHVRVKSENALETEFRCPECGQILKEHNNDSNVNNLKKQVQEIEIYLSEQEKIIMQGLEKAKEKERVKLEKRSKKKTKRKIIKKKPKPKKTPKKKRSRKKLKRKKVRNKPPRKKPKTKKTSKKKPKKPNKKTSKKRKLRR